MLHGLQSANTIVFALFQYYLYIIIISRNLGVNYSLVPLNHIESVLLCGESRIEREPAAPQADIAVSSFFNKHIFYQPCYRYTILQNYQAIKLIFRSKPILSNNFLFIWHSFQQACQTLISVEISFSSDFVCKYTNYF